MLRRPFPMTEVALSVRELTSERNINSYRYYKGTEAGQLPSFFLWRNPMYSFTVSIIHP